MISNYKVINEFIEMSQKNSLYRYYKNIFKQLYGKRYVYLLNIINNEEYVSIKVRILNEFYTKLDFIENCGDVIINQTVFDLPFSLDGNYNKVYFNSDKYLFPIIGSYQAKDNLVLCSYPDPITLFKSFKNDPDSTIKKLEKLLNTTMTEEIIKICSQIYKNAIMPS